MPVSPVRAAAPSPYLPFSDGVEAIAPDEAETLEAIIASLSTVSRILADRYRHAVRPSHAKSHGLIKGTLTVPGDLPEPLAQGLFARAGTYPMIARLSTEPGELMGDSVHTPRGFSLKVIGVEGEMLAGHEGEVTQDLLLNSGRRFAVADLKGFLRIQRFLEEIVNQPEGTKKAGTALGYAANGALHLVGHDSALLDFFGHPHTHPLGESYFSHAPLRWGDYVAKLGLFPADPELERLGTVTIEPAFRYSALKDAVTAHFARAGATYELRAQLRTNERTQPVEDASVEWSEAESPYRTVARLSFPAQDAYSPARRVFCDDRLSFSPAHTLAAHRPLGSLMRGRITAYRRIAELRAGLNAVTRVEPRSIDEIPD